MDSWRRFQVGAVYRHRSIENSVRMKMYRNGFMNIYIICGKIYMIVSLGEYKRPSMNLFSVEM